MHPLIVALVTIPLIWDASSTPDVEYYMLRYGTAPHAYTDWQSVDDQLAYVLEIVAPDWGEFIYIVCTCFKAGIESEPSNEVIWSAHRLRISRASENQVTLIWECIQGRFYTLQCADSVDGAYTDIFTLQAIVTGTTETTVETGDGNRRFWRVRWQ